VSPVLTDVRTSIDFLSLRLRPFRGSGSSSEDEDEDEDKYGKPSESSDSSVFVLTPPAFPPVDVSGSSEGLPSSSDSRVSSSL
jgi:hypothetical protein